MLERPSRWNSIIGDGLHLMSYDSKTTSLGCGQVKAEPECSGCSQGYLEGRRTGSPVAAATGASARRSGWRSAAVVGGGGAVFGGAPGTTGPGSVNVGGGGPTALASVRVPNAARAPVMVPSAAKQ